MTSRFANFLKQQGFPGIRLPDSDTDFGAEYLSERLDRLESEFKPFLGAKVPEDDGETEETEETGESEEEEEGAHSDN